MEEIFANNVTKIFGHLVHSGLRNCEDTRAWLHACNVVVNYHEDEFMFVIIFVILKHNGHIKRNIKFTLGVDAAARVRDLGLGQVVVGAVAGEGGTHRGPWHCKD